MNNYQNQSQQNRQGYYLSEQHLKLMHIMHLSGFSLQEYIANELELNPVLEVEPETDLNDQEEIPEEIKSECDFELLWQEDDLFEKNYVQNSSNENYYEAPVVHYNSLPEILKDQIHMMNIGEDVMDIACYIVDELDDGGYLRRKVSEVADDYSFFNGKLINEEKIDEALTILQQCDPAGIGARDLRECLILQLNRKSTSGCRIYELSLELLTDHYQDFLQHQFSKIKTALGASDKELEKCLQYISKLNPHPVTETNKYELFKEQIIPDFEVHVEDSEIHVSLTSSEFAKLRVNTNYAVENINTLTKTEKRQLNSYCQNLITEATTFVGLLRERETTMLNIMKIIAQMQHDFFRTGDMKELRPMILQDIANRAGFDISTVSRITSNKYVQTPFGVFPLKNLFMRALPSEGVPSTTIQVQNLIKEIVNEENRLRPLSDKDIVQLLKQRDIVIARRTVVKYRELAGILNSSLRKKHQSILSN